MSKICRTFAANFDKAMKKMQYIQPSIDITVVETARLMGDPLLGSGTAPSPVPGRRSSGDVID